MSGMKNNLITCKKCNTQFVKGAKFCPSCGAKNKKVFYKQWWFIVIVVIVICIIISSIGSNKSDKEVADNAETTTSVDMKINESNEISSEENESKETTDSIRPDFKAAMDSYEEFYNEYCEFMINYNDNTTDIKLIAQYADMMKKVVDMDAKFKAWENTDLNDEELKYYIDVQARVTQKLAEVVTK